MIITVANQKGGVGKTDLSVNLASCLAKTGKRILLVDLDPQANATYYLSGKKYKLTTHDLLTKDDVGVKDVAVETGIDGLFLAPSHHKLSAAQAELINDIGMQFKLKKKLKNIGKKDKYDYVFIDTPPSLNVLTINAMTTSDGVIVPVQVHHLAVEGMEKIVNTVDLVRREINPGIEINGFVLTMYDKRNKLSRQIEKDVRSRFGDKVFRSTIPVNIDLARAPRSHKPIIHHSSESRGAYAYRRLAKEFESR
ncbi:MAG: ParA family protein [Candidatus Aenigmarchaeota archaeon]|nr:ParA family protein [Candidatus Aenigmarchaeota archaeon]